MYGGTISLFKTGDIEVNSVNSNHAFSDLLVLLSTTESVKHVEWLYETIIIFDFK